MNVSDNQIGRADFKVEDGLKVTATVDRPKVPADGLQVVKVDVDVERFGDPVSGLYLSVIPNKESVGANPQTIPVPARYCVNGGQQWPYGDRTNLTFQKPFDIYTDADGKASFTLQTGTVPGNLGLYVWAKDSNTGTLRTTNISDARADITIENQATGTGSTRDVGKALGKAANDKGFAAPTDVYSLSDLLIKNASADPGLGGLAFAPVFGSAGYGVLVMPQAQRISPAARQLHHRERRVDRHPAERLDPLIGALYGGPLSTGYAAWWATVKGGAMPPGAAVRSVVHRDDDAGDDGLVPRSRRPARSPTSAAGSTSATRTTSSPAAAEHSLRPVRDRLDVVAVGVEHERPVVRRVVVGP